MKIPYKKQFVVPAALAVITLLFFVFTSPTKLPIAILLVPFFLIFLLVYTGVLGVATAFHLKNRRLIALVGAIFTVVLLLLGSLHQLTFRDIALSLAIVFVLTWYISRLQQ